MKTSEIILCITFLWTAALQLQRSDAESEQTAAACHVGFTQSLS